MGVDHRPVQFLLPPWPDGTPGRRGSGAGERHTDLLASAFLHDVGKSRVRLRIWERVFVASGARLLPEAGGGGCGGSGCMETAVRRRHPQAREGARLAWEAGGSEPTVSLVRPQHEERDENALVPSPGKGPFHHPARSSILPKRGMTDRPRLFSEPMDRTEVAHEP
jgi:hypothetical protein